MCNQFSQLTHVGEEVSLRRAHAKSRMWKKRFKTRSCHVLCANSGGSKTGGNSPNQSTLTKCW